MTYGVQFRGIGRGPRFPRQPFPLGAEFSGLVGLRNEPPMRSLSTPADLSSNLPLPYSIARLLRFAGCESWSAWSTCTTCRGCKSMTAATICVPRARAEIRGSTGMGRESGCAAASARRVGRPARRQVAAARIADFVKCRDRRRFGTDASVESVICASLDAARLLIDEGPG